MAQLDQLSIRSYTRQVRSHYHEYHQLVLPLQGSIDIQVGEYQGLVSLGDCVVIPALQRHSFKSHEAARFMVADLLSLPDNLRSANQAKFSVSAPLLAFIQFAEQQLEFEQNSSLESQMFQLFWQLLQQQTCRTQPDERIAKVIAVLQQDIAQQPSLSQLASIACLSLTQYKKLFKQGLGMTTQAYLTELRMQKAKALLTHTDLPVAIIAQRVGYLNISAFSRRFSIHFGQSPRGFAS